MPDGTAATVFAPAPVKQGPCVLYHLESPPASFPHLTNPLLLGKVRRYAFAKPEDAIRFAGGGKMAKVCKITANFEPAQNKVIGSIGLFCADSQYKLLGKYTVEELERIMADGIRSQAKYADDGLHGIEMVARK